MEELKTKIMIECLHHSAVAQNIDGLIIAALLFILLCVLAFLGFADNDNIIGKS